jgi:DNA-binding response OmpR family regulator
MLSGVSGLQICRQVRHKNHPKRLLCSQQKLIDSHFHTVLRLDLGADCFGSRFKFNPQGVELI